MVECKLIMPYRMRHMFSALSPPILLVACLAVFAAGFVKGFAGFGFSVAFTPVFSLLFGHPREVVFVALCLGAVLSVAVMAESRHALRRNTIAPMLAGTVIGTPIGIVVLGLLNVRALKLAICALALFAASLRLVRMRLAIGRHAGPLFLGGLLGGLLNGVTSMGGPVPALIVALQHRDIAETRAILVSFNLLSYALAIAVAAGTGLAQWSWLRPAAWLLPIAAIGSFCGIHLVRRVSLPAFGVFITAVIGLSGLAGLASVLRN